MLNKNFGRLLLRYGNNNPKEICLNDFTGAFCGCGWVDYVRMFKLYKFAIYKKI